MRGIKYECGQAEVYSRPKNMQSTTIHNINTNEYVFVNFWWVDCKN